MGKAVRAIVIEGDKILVMHRNKQGSQYYTLVGGRVNEGESLEQALVREIKEETGLEIVEARPVYFEEHPEPYNQQYIYLCKVAPHGDIAIQEYSEEGMMNRVDINIHTPMWADIGSFKSLAFRTPQLQTAIVQGMKKGFPNEPVKL
jgi:8-oxo-dGTP pyrophosphatase MutT (NUDIX family)